MLYIPFMASGFQFEYMRHPAQARLATVLATTNCEVYTLSKDSGAFALL